MDDRIDIDLRNVSIEMIRVLQKAFTEQRPITIRTTIVDDEGAESEVTGLVEQLHISNDLHGFLSTLVVLRYQR